MTTGRGRPAFYVTMLAAQRKDMPSGRAPGGGRTHDDPDAFRFPGRSHSPRGRHHKASPVILIRIVRRVRSMRSEEHTSELQSRGHLVCRLLLEKKNLDLQKATHVAEISLPPFATV